LVEQQILRRLHDKELPAGFRVALPREERQRNEFNALRNCLGKKRLIAFQGVSEGPPKLGRGEALIHLQVSEGENRASDLRRAGK
jgi:hypothetical protein